MQPPTNRIHGVNVAMDYRQANTIPECFIQKNCPWINFINQLLQMSFRSDWIEIKYIQEKFLFD